MSTCTQGARAAARRAPLAGQRRYLRPGGGRQGRCESPPGPGGREGTGPRHEAHPQAQTMNALRSSLDRRGHDEVAWAGPRRPAPRRRLCSSCDAGMGDQPAPGTGPRPPDQLRATRCGCIHALMHSRPCLTTVLYSQPGRDDDNDDASAPPGTRSATNQRLVRRTPWGVLPRGHPPLIPARHKRPPPL